MRKLTKKIIAIAFVFLGFVRRKNKIVHSKNLITPIYFHNPSKELFEKCILWLIKKNYYFISTDELLNIIANKKPVSNGAVCITVDDGWKDNLNNILPICTELKIPITIFISTAPIENGCYWWSYIKEYNKITDNKINLENCKKISNIERTHILDSIKSRIKLPREAMKKEDVIRISRLNHVTIGNHTVNHPITIKCDSDELNYEISEASKVLNLWIDDSILYFAYPNGDFDNREIPILKRNKIKMAFTTIPKHIDSSAKIDPFKVPRFSVNDDGSFYENICKMVGVWQPWFK